MDDKGLRGLSGLLGGEDKLRMPGMENEFFFPAKHSEILVFAKIESALEYAIEIWMP